MATVQDFITGKAETEIATLLSLKEPIVTMTASSDANIASQANSLYQTQLSLESQLPDVLNALQSSNMDAGTLATATIFYAEMEKQISDVHSLMQSAGMNVNTDVSKYWQYGALILLGFVAISLFGKKR